MKFKIEQAAAVFRCFYATHLESREEEMLYALNKVLGDTPDERLDALEHPVAGATETQVNDGRVSGTIYSFSKEINAQLKAKDVEIEWLRVRVKALRLAITLAYEELNNRYDGADDSYARWLELTMQDMQLTLEADDLAAEKGSKPKEKAK